ncbi:DUF732 domain-containing protein [Rhodococcus sp. NPDC060086]|uniref:DUF732 domain-containing protein n=1 Tax=Rhodococcus sp. NPDC060086 TaxID=3347055 RepID=UPI00364890FA
MPARTRSRSTRVLGAIAAALTSAAVLAACGSDDSTATNTPDVTTTTSATTSAEATGSEETAPGDTTSDASGTEDTTTDAAPTSPGEAATAPPPGSQPAPSESGEAFLAALRDAGVEPSDEASSIAIADYICGAEAQGGAPDEIKTMVTALVGSGSVAAGEEITEEDASTTADTYISVAHDTYCS